jgi:hypothetical protein
MLAAMIGEIDWCSRESTLCAMLALAENRQRMRSESAAPAWFGDEIRSTRDTTS